MSATGDASDNRRSINATEPKASNHNVGTTNSQLSCVGFAKLKTGGKSQEESLELAEFGAELTRHMTTKAATKVKSSKIESVMIDRRASDNVRLAWLEAHSSKTQTEANVPTDEATHASAVGSFQAHTVNKILPSNPKIDHDYVVQFKPVDQNRVLTKSKKYQTGLGLESKPEPKLGKVSYEGLKGSENLTGQFTYMSKRQADSCKSKNSKDRKSESLLIIKSPEKKESDLGKRLRDYDLESEKGDNEDKRKRTYKYKIKTISAKIIHPCIETIKMVGGLQPSSGSSEDSSSAKTSVVITDETDVSDENSVQHTNSQSEKNVTARKISSGNVTLAAIELYKNKDERKSSEQNKREKVFEVSSRGDENFTKGATSFADRSAYRSRHIESQLEEKTSGIIKTTGKDVKPISEECSEIQTSEDNLSPLEDDDDNLAVPAPVRKTMSPGDITLKENYKTSRESSQASISSSEEVLPLEENLLAPENAIKKEGGVNKDKKFYEQRKTVSTCKNGLSSSEESMTLLSKSKSESDTDTKESWIDLRSESTSASKKGLTSSEEGVTSGENDTSKKKEDELKYSEKRISSSEIIGSEAIVISKRDRIQNLLSDIKTVMTSVVTPSNVISKPYTCEIVGQSEKVDKKELISKKPLPPTEGSESDESNISGDTDSTSLEIERISERMLPIGGTITLIKGKPPSERNTTPSWSSVSSLLEGMICKIRNAAGNKTYDKSPTSSLSTPYKETPVQKIKKDLPQKSMTSNIKVNKIKSPYIEKLSSESDTSSEESQQQMKFLCEQVIKGLASTNKDNFMTAHFCIDSITFGIRRSLSEERLYSIEADTDTHKETRISETKLPSATSSVLPDKVCDACTFLVLLQTLIIRERVVHFAFCKMDVCIVHSIGLGHENAHVYRYLLKKMPICEFCTFPSVEKMILQLVQSRRGVLMHKAEHLPPIYVIFPSYTESNRTIGRVVHLHKKKVSDYGKKAKIRVMMADRYILFPKLNDSSIWRNTPKRDDTPNKIIAPKTKSRNVPAEMNDILELNESIVEESKSKINIEYKTLKATPSKKKPSKRKARKCVLKKWSVQMTASNAQVNRKNGSSSDEPISPNVATRSESALTNLARTELIALNSKRRRCILKKWTVKMSAKSKRTIIHKCEEQSLIESSHPSDSDVPVETTQIKTEPTSATLKASDTSQFHKHKQIHSVVLVRKKQPWWKCSTKKTTVKGKLLVDTVPKKKPNIYKNILHPKYQQPLYPIQSRTNRQLETCMSTRQDVMAQRMAYHYIRELTVGRTESTSQGDEKKFVKPSLTDFQSSEYEKRRTFIRDSRQSKPSTSDKTISNDLEYYVAKESPDKELSTNQQGSDRPLDLSKIDLSQIDYHFENCPIIQKGDTPYRHFLKLQQVYKTKNFEDSWVEYHVEDCSYFMIDGTTVTDLKLVHLVLAEKKDDICECAIKLIKGGNIYRKDKSSHTFHHDLCLLFPKLLESGDIDLQGLFNPNIPSREFDENDVIRLYFISKHSDTKDAHVIDYCEIPISKFSEVQGGIKHAFGILKNKVEAMNQSTQVYARHDTSVQFYEKCSSGEIASTSNQPDLRTYQLEDSHDSLPSAVCPPHVQLEEYQRYLSLPREDSKGEDSTTVYSLEDCLIYASEHMTEDSMSPTLPDSLGVGDNKGILKQSSECSSKIGYLRQFIPSPRPVDLTRDDKSVNRQGISLTLSPSQDKGKENQIYYHLGDFTTQIQKGVALDQLVASPKPLLIKDDSSAIVCQPGHTSNQNLLSPPTSLQVISLNEMDRNDKQLHEQPTYQQLGDKSKGDKLQSVKFQKYASSQHVILPRLMENSLRHGHSSDSIQRFHQDVRIGSQENITEDCTCNLAESVEIYRYVLALEKKFKQTLCAYHSALYEEQLAKYQRTLSQEDLSHIQKYSLDAVASPTRVQKGLRKYVYSSDTSFEYGRITNQRTRSYGDLINRKSLSHHSQEYTSNEGVFQRHHAEQLCLKGVYIPGHQRGRSKQHIDSQKNITREHRTRQSYFKPQKSLRDQEVLPRHMEGRFRQRSHSEDITQGRATDQSRASSRRNSSEDECPHTWQSWREGPAPF